MPPPHQTSEVQRSRTVLQREDFAIQRGGRMECTVVGADGLTHVLSRQRPGRDGRFTDEGAYRCGIEQAVGENGR